MSTQTHTLSTTERLDDEFYYGYRTIISYGEKGQVIYSYKPLLPAEQRAKAEAARAEAEAKARQEAEAQATELEIQLRELEARYKTLADPDRVCKETLYCRSA